MELVFHELKLNSAIQHFINVASRVGITGMILTIAKCNCLFINHENQKGICGGLMGEFDKKNSVFFWIWNLPNRLKCQSFRFLGIFSSLLFVLLLGALLLSFYHLKRLRLITRKMDVKIRFL